MPMSSYYRQLREKVGVDLLLIPAVAAVVRDEHGRVLVQRRHDGSWSLPAGAVEPGEHPAQAVAREVFEETGLRVRPERLLGVFGGGHRFRATYPNGHRVEYFVTLFECRRLSGTLRSIDGESESLHYFSAEEVPPLATEYPRELLNPGARDAYFTWQELWVEPAHC